MCLGTTPGLRHNQMFCKQAEAQQGAQRKQSKDWKNFIHPAVSFIVHSNRNLLLWVLCKELATGLGWGLVVDCCLPFMLEVRHSQTSEKFLVWKVWRYLKKLFSPTFQLFQEETARYEEVGNETEGDCDCDFHRRQKSSSLLSSLFFVQPDYKHFVLELRTSAVC